MIIFLRVLLLFSIINGSKQAGNCKLKHGYLLICEDINQGPISNWSFSSQDEFKWSEISDLSITKNRIKSFKNGIFTKLTNVETINLRENELSAIDFNEFGNNLKLTALDVQSNQISEIKPIKNSTVINISRLWVGFNDLSDISELCKLTKLQMLSLSGNRRLDYSKVMFNCWSQLTLLDLADTNLKSLNHDYRVLTGCNKLEKLYLMDNNLEMLCLEHFPALPQLTELSIRNNSLISLDVLELKMKFRKLSMIEMTDNNWSCDYYEGTLKTQLKESNITEFLRFIGSQCLHNSTMDAAVQYCP